LKLFVSDDICYDEDLYGVIGNTDFKLFFIKTKIFKSISNINNILINE